MNKESLVLYEKVGDVGVLTLNHPETLNAFSNALGREFIRQLEHASDDARAILIRGAGRAFSSGANLSGGGINLNDPDRDFGAELDAFFNPIIRNMRDYPVPIVTAVHGPAAGIGCSIALMGDIIVATENAYFLQAFCNIGLAPDGGSPFVLAHAAGRVRAMEMMLLGEKYPASKAFDDGLVTRVVAEDELEDVSLNYANRLAAGPTKTLGMIRKSAWAALTSTLDDQLDRERYIQREAGRSDDTVEGIMAFIEKRTARFKGR